MVSVTSNKHRRLLFLNYVEKVSPAELESVRDELAALVEDLPPELRILADFSRLEFMDPACTAEIGRTMEMLDKHGVSLVVRVIPDPSKDIGMNILTIFHYAHRPRIITCENLAKALERLAMWE